MRGEEREGETYLGQSEDFDGVIRVSQSLLQVSLEGPSHMNWLHSLKQSLQNGDTQSGLFPEDNTRDLISSHILPDRSKT